MHHCGHSSVMVLPSGQVVEARRGTLQHFAIPNPMVWNSLEEWRAYAPYIQSDLLLRPLPAHFNATQTWIAQWHEESTLCLQQDTDGVWKLLPGGTATVMVADWATGTMVPLYMCLNTGMMWCQGRYFTDFSETPLQVAQVWRCEFGSWYRIWDAYTASA